MTAPLKNLNYDIFPLSGKRAVVTKSVIACFADIRGFTAFVRNDSKQDHPVVYKLLEAFYYALNSALKAAIENIDDQTFFGRQLKMAVSPKVTKTMGDGIMLVWEYPNSTEDKIRIGFKLFVLDFVQLFQQKFYDQKGELANTHPLHSKLINGLEIGIGIASGDALKLTGFGSKNVDYLGSIINLAARLQEEARPCGIVARITFDFNLFLEKAYSYKEGTLKAVEVKGIDERLLVWKVKKAILSRRRPKQLDTFLHAQNSMEEQEDFNDFKKCPLTVDDTQNIFDIRAKFEVQFVSDLCERLISKDLDEEVLDKIDPDISGDLFHQTIARHSIADPLEGEKRARFIDWAYQKTYDVHHSAGEQPEEVIAQHKNIFRAIEALNISAVRKEMRKHLINNCTLGREKIINDILANYDADSED